MPTDAESVLGFDGGGFCEREADFGAEDDDLLRLFKKMIFAEFFLCCDLICLRMQFRPTS